MIRDDIQRLIEEAISGLVDDGKLPPAALVVAFEVLDPKSADHGDYATNFALVATKALGVSPREIAELLREMLWSLGSGKLAGIDVAGPGFLNLRLETAYVAGFLSEILRRDNLAATENPHPLKINVEFVSVNPNGPITVGSGRGAAYGSTLCNVLEAAGNTVHREYYINDGVNSEQMRLFAESVRSHALGLPLPEGGYRGEYVKGVADALEADAAAGHPHTRHSARVSSSSSATPSNISAAHRYLAAVSEFERFSGADRYVKATTQTLQDLSLHYMTMSQSRDLAAFGVEFDTWFSEQSLHDSGEVTRSVDELIAKGAADDEPYRTKLKLGKAGKVEEVSREEQAGEVDDEDGEATGTVADTVERSGPTTNPTLWLRSTKFADDMDRVLRRKDGRLTYIASDVAYHADKLNRPPNADKLITILGPDHHGYIGRLHAVFAALLENFAQGSDESEFTEADALIYRDAAEKQACLDALEQARERLDIQIFQIVRFVKDGKPAPMRKRDGNIYELRDLVNELGKSMAPDADEAEQSRIGRDVARFFYLMRSHDTHMDFDIDLATKQSEDNPVFYAQYAHARICSILRKAQDVGLLPNEDHLAFIRDPKELALIRKIADLPHEIQRVTDDYGVHRLTTYVVELARTYHAFYDACKVIQPDQPELSQARLALCKATQMGLKSTFDLLGISAPESM